LFSDSSLDKTLDSNELSSSTTATFLQLAFFLVLAKATYNLVGFDFFVGVVGADVVGLSVRLSLYLLM